MSTINENNIIEVDDSKILPGTAGVMITQNGQTLTIPIYNQAAKPKYPVQETGYYKCESVSPTEIVEEAQYVFLKLIRDEIQYDMVKLYKRAEDEFTQRFYMEETANLPGLGDCRIEVIGRINEIAGVVNYSIRNVYDNKLIASAEFSPAEYVQLHTITDWVISDDSYTAIGFSEIQTQADVVYSGSWNGRQILQDTEIGAWFPAQTIKVIPLVRNIPAVGGVYNMDATVKVDLYRGGHVPISTFGLIGYCEEYCFVADSTNAVYGYYQFPYVQPDWDFNLSGFSGERITNTTLAGSTVEPLRGFTLYFNYLQFKDIYFDFYSDENIVGGIYNLHLEIDLASSQVSILGDNQTFTDQTCVLPATNGVYSMDLTVQYEKDSSTLIISSILANFIINIPYGSDAWMSFIDKVEISAVNSDADLTRRFEPQAYCVYEGALTEDEITNIDTILRQIAYNNKEVTE